MFDHDRYTMIDSATLDTFDRWAQEAIPTGGFCTAVLINDLRGAALRADDNNARFLWHVVSYCHNQLPAVCWGSMDAVAAWPQRLKEMQNQP